MYKYYVWADCHSRNGTILPMSAIFTIDEKLSEKLIEDIKDKISREENLRKDDILIKNIIKLED